LSFKKGASATASDRYAIRGTVRIGDASLADAQVAYLTSGRTSIEDALRWDILGLGRLDVVDSTGARSRAGTTTFRVPRTVDAFAVAVTGRGGAPVLTLTGPGGATVSTAGSGDGVHAEAVHDRGASTLDRAG
jgi:hypothetical protein